MRVRQKERGIGLRDRLLSRPEMLGKMAKLTPGLANWANRQPLLRAGLQLGLGIHKDKLLPEFHGEAFEDWYRKQPPPAGDPTKAVLFSTCFVNYNHPDLGKDLRRGLFAERHRRWACRSRTVAACRPWKRAISIWPRSWRGKMWGRCCPYVREGEEGPGGQSHLLLHDAQRVWRIGGHAGSARGGRGHHGPLRVSVSAEARGQIQPRFPHHAGACGLSRPCHLRAQNIGFRSRDLMRLIPGTTVKMVEQCCGHDGTWAMRKEFFPLSLLAGKKAFDQMQAVEAKVMATDCPLAAIQFQQAHRAAAHSSHPGAGARLSRRRFSQTLDPPEEKE